LKKVLIITYYWPPVSSPGVQRWLKFSKYLRSFDIEPIILTVDNPVAPSTDQSLMDDVPRGTKVHSTAGWEPTAVFNRLVGKKGNTTAVGLGDIQDTTSPIKRLAKYLRSNVFVPDAKLGWYYSARNKAVQMTKQYNIQTIITTGPPHTAHLIGRYVKKQDSSVRWVADFRDPWTGLYYEQYLKRSTRSKKKNEGLEQAVLQESDVVITVSSGLKRSFEKSASIIEVLPNGFDSADLPAVPAIKNSTCTIAYTGNLKATQHIPSFWIALRTVADELPISMTIVGNVADSVLQSITEYKLTDVVTIKPFVPHQEAIAEMMKADILWLPIPQAIGNESIVTGKIFEYLASRTPILSIGPLDGDAAAILHNCDRESMFQYDDEAGMTSYLRQKVTEWKAAGKVEKHQSDKHMIYERKALTADLADIILQS